MRPVWELEFLQETPDVPAEPARDDWMSSAAEEHERDYGESS